MTPDLTPADLRLIERGLATLWESIAATDPQDAELERINTVQHKITIALGY